MQFIHNPNDVKEFIENKLNETKKKKKHDVYYAVHDNMMYDNMEMREGDTTRQRGRLRGHTANLQNVNGTCIAMQQNI